MEKPFLKFYTRDWQADSALRQCSAAARGVWMELLCIMAQNDNDTCGYLCANGRLTESLNLSVIQRLTGLLKEEIESGMKELDAAGVFSRNEAGVIFSRRMVKEAIRSRINKQNGDKGGNPALKVGITESDKQNSNPHGISRDQRLEVRLEAKNNTEKKEESAPPDVGTKPPVNAPKPEKHKYGEYKHVLLTDADYDSLLADYGQENLDRLIKDLDEGIELKPKKYQYNNHRLAIHKWAVTAGIRKGGRAQDARDRELEEQARKMNEQAGFKLDKDKNGDD